MALSRQPNAFAAFGKSAQEYPICMRRGEGITSNDDNNNQIAITPHKVWSGDQTKYQATWNHFDCHIVIICILSTSDYTLTCSPADTLHHPTYISAVQLEIFGIQCCACHMSLSRSRPATGNGNVMCAALKFQHLNLTKQKGARIVANTHTRAHKPAHWQMQESIRKIHSKT